MYIYIYIYIYVPAPSSLGTPAFHGMVPGLDCPSECNMHTMHAYACICTHMHEYMHLHVHISYACMAYACRPMSAR